MPTISGKGGNIDAWQKYDKQSVEQRAPDGKLTDKVAHGESAVANLKEAGQNLLNTFDPTNHFRDSWRDADKGDFGFGRMFAFLMLPWDAMREVADVVTGPVKMVKNLGDAAVHGVAAGIAKLGGGGGGDGDG